MLKSCNSSSIHYSVFNGDIHSSILPLPTIQLYKKNINIIMRNVNKCP